jgi:hypothetical protein
VCSVHAPQLRKAQERIKDLEWKPITPDSLPKVGDEAMNPTTGEVIASPSFYDDLNYELWIDCGWTHYRPINPPERTKEGK